MIMRRWMVAVGLVLLSLLQGTPVLADQSITTITPLPTSTPSPTDILFTTPTPTATPFPTFTDSSTPTPSTLPGTGTSSSSLLWLIGLFIISTATYFLLPSRRK